MEQTKRIALLAAALPFLCIAAVRGQLPGDAVHRDTIGAERTFSARFVHRIDIGYRPEWIAPTNDFVLGRNRAGRPIDFSNSVHLRYALAFRPGTFAERISGGAWQGIGLAHYRFGNSRELGDPTAIYLFQGARIARITARLSFDYEWNFGLSFGWKSYSHPKDNKMNIMIGSKINALLNASFYFDWRISRRLGIEAGLTMTHFSNGNTRLPNAGLNAIGGRIGLCCNLGEMTEASAPDIPMHAPAFPRHVSYDVVLFGSWRRKGVAFTDKLYASPDSYPVVGFNVSPMYNFGYKFRAGISLDGIYDGSANVYTEDYIVEEGGYDPGYTFYQPSADRQMALGISLRAEFVMPYFSVNAGIGLNVLHGGGDLRSFYQILALKIGMTHSSFLHIGYCLKDFHNPNFLMLGVGYRFNNKYPRLK